MHRSRVAAFTLVEIMMAIVIALIVIALAVPALSSAFGSKDLDQSFQQFDDFVRTTQTRAIQQKRDYLLIWQKEGITAEPTVAAPEDADTEIDMYPAGNAKITLHRLVALDKKPPGEWPIWRSGTMEPVKIEYDGPLGRWTAEYEALGGRGRLILMEEK